MGLWQQFPYLKHQSWGSADARSPHLLFKFYLEFLLNAKFPAQLNIVYLWDGMI